MDIAWNEPWFIAVNYAALLAAAVWLLRLRQIKPPPAMLPNNPEDDAHRREP